MYTQFLKTIKVTNSTVISTVFFYIITKRGLYLGDCLGALRLNLARITSYTENDNINT